jgi:xanthine/uracil permease
MDRVEKILPASVTGPVAMIIGLTLAGNAMADAAPAAGQPQVVWVISLVTLLSTIVYSKRLKGVLGQLPLLLGALTGCVTALLVHVAAGLLAAQAQLGGGSGADAHRHCHHPGIHRAYVSIGHLCERSGAPQGQETL